MTTINANTITAADIETGLNELGELIQQLKTKTRSIKTNDYTVICLTKMGNNLLILTEYGLFIGSTFDNLQYWSGNNFEDVLDYENGNKLTSIYIDDNSSSFCLVGYNFLICASWENNGQINSQIFQKSGKLTGVTYGGRYLAVGKSGLMYYSTPSGAEGNSVTNFIKLAAVSVFNIENVVYVENAAKYFIVCNYGKFLYSENLNFWTPISLGTTENLRYINICGNYLAVVGDSSKLYISNDIETTTTTKTTTTTTNETTKATSTRETETTNTTTGTMKTGLTMGTTETTTTTTTTTTITEKTEIDSNYSSTETTTRDTYIKITLDGNTSSTKEILITTTDASGTTTTQRSATIITTLTDDGTTITTTKTDENGKTTTQTMKLNYKIDLEKASETTTTVETKTEITATTITTETTTANEEETTNNEEETTNETTTNEEETTNETTTNEEETTNENTTTEIPAKKYTITTTTETKTEDANGNTTTTKTEIIKEIITGTQKTTITTTTKDEKGDTIGTPTETTTETEISTITTTTTETDASGNETTTTETGTYSGELPTTAGETTQTTTTTTETTTTIKRILTAKTWMPVNTGFSGVNFRYIGLHNNIYFITGDGGLVIYSFDLFNWRRVIIGETHNIYSINYVGGYYYISGTGRFLARSSDLLTWDKKYLFK